MNFLVSPRHNLPEIIFLFLGALFWSVMTVQVGEFPDAWTFDEKPEQRVSHVALEGKPMPQMFLSSWINLVFNAVDAMPKGGTLSLKTRRDQEMAIVEITDTGTGISEEVRKLPTRPPSPECRCA